MGFFVTFEGPEGGGKTTQMRLAGAFLRQHGREVLETREPGGTRIGERVRGILLDPEYAEMLPPTEFLLFSAGRSQHVGQVIRPHLAKGGIVLSDRYADASLAYQGYGRLQDVAVLRAITCFATGGLIPDLTVCLDVPIEVGLRRKSGGTGDAWNRMEQQALDYHARVRAGYLAMAAQEPGRWMVVDATARADEVQSIIRCELTRRLGLPQARA